MRVSVGSQPTAVRARRLAFVLCTLVGSGTLAGSLHGAEIIHDAEHLIVAAQHGAKWAKEDAEIDALLAGIRQKHGGRPPNIVYILLDDLGFGEIGMPDLDVVRGYSTPNISRIASEGLSLMRMYTEPSCTPTRVAMMTGRTPFRTGFDEAKAVPEGEGLPGWEVTLAEVLSEAGYATVHIGKWHLRY